MALPLAFGLHALVDYDLDFLAVAAPTVLVSAALLGAGRPRRDGRGEGSSRPGAVVGAVAAIWVLVAPGALDALGRRRVPAERRRRDLDAAAARLRGARRGLNPLSPEPLFARADGRDGRRDNRAGADAFYVQATRLQPENPATWYELGDLPLRSRATCAAPTTRSTPRTRSIRRAASSTQGGPLDRREGRGQRPENPACGR